MFSAPAHGTLGGFGGFWVLGFWGLGFGFWSLGFMFRVRVAFAFACRLNIKKHFCPFVSGPYEHFIIFLIAVAVCFYFSGCMPTALPPLRLSRGLCILQPRTQLKVSPPQIRCLFGKHFKRN